MLVLNVSISGLGGTNINVSMVYSLDGTRNETIPVVVKSRENSFVVSYTGLVTLPELPRGSHSITVYSEYNIYNAYQNGVLVPKDTRLDSNTVHFTISDTIPTEETIPPVISNLSVENKTYTSAELALRLSFNLDKTVSWIAYCLDNQANTTLAGWYNPDIYGKQFNATLTGLSEGSHSIVVYANNTAEYTGVSDTIYFSIAPSFWVQQAPMPTARTSLGVAVVNGKIYVIGGFSSDQNTFLAINEEYDPSTNTWTEKAPMPTPRSGCAVVACENKIYAIGGQIAIGTTDDLTNVTEVYDPATDTWSQKAPFPILRYGFSANVVEGRIYLIGGSPNGTLNQVYDPATDSWTTKAPIPTAAYVSASAVLDNKIYVISNLTQIYNPKTDTWSFGVPIPTNVTQAAAGATTGVAAPKAIYVIGGSTDFFCPWSEFHSSVFSRKRFLEYGRFYANCPSPIRA